MNKLTRKEVYEVIDTERNYQDNLGPDRTNHQPHTVGNYITMLQHYQGQLVTAWTLNAGDEKALDIMRKIAGIAVHCMEVHGAPKREPIQ